MAVVSVAAFWGHEAAAQVNGQMKLSYCKGKVASSSDIGMSGAGTLEAASYIPSSMVSNYRDLKVVGIKAGLSSKLNVETLTVWVRESLDGENLCECTISKAGGDEIRKGWNYLIPASPYSAGRNTGFYVGCTIKQKGTSYPVSVVGNDHDGGLYVKANNAWTDRCKEGKGTLSIEAIIEASNLPTFDLALNDVALPDRIKGGSEATGTLSISNEASMTVSGFDIVYDIEGMQPQTVTISRELPPCTEDTVTFNFTPALDGRKRALPMSVSIARLEEGEDVDNSNNTFNTRFDLVKHDFVKVPVMEEFTTEPCSNCPRAAEIVHAVLDDERYGGGKVAAVCHHSGFQTDWLTNDADREYVWFYGGSSFAPAIMFDRSASEGSSPVRGVSGAEDMMKTLDDIMSVPASVALECRAVYDKSKNCVVVNVEGSHDWDFNIEEPRITLYLLENNIPARRQAGASDDYLQQHVVRAYNDTWGEPYEVNEDGDFSYSREVGIDDSWVRDNMEVVAFVGSYDPDAYWNCGIENAAVCKIDWSSSQVGVENMETDSILMTEWFTIDGIPAVSPQRHCLYMRVDYFLNGSKKTSKVYIP